MQNLTMNGLCQSLPQMKDLDAGGQIPYQELLEAVVESLKVSGGCRIRRFISQATVDELNDDFAPYFDKAKQLKSDFWAKETRRVTGCVSKSNAFAVKIVGNQLWQEVGCHFLTSTLQWWNGDKQERSTSYPQLNNTSVFRIRPGATAQGLHRDDIICHVHHSSSTSHQMGRDYGIGLFVAGTPSTRSNGATRFIPGSHLWDYARPPLEDLAVYAELDPGDAFVMLAGCYHAGSANTTVDEYRQLYSTFTGRGWCRQEENQYLANDVERVRMLPLSLQRFIGWGLSLPFMGWVDLEDPIRNIRGQQDKERAGVTYF